MNKTQNIRPVLKRICFAAAFILPAAFLSGFFLLDSDADYFLKIYRGIDVYNRVYKEIAVNYVDTLDPSDLMRAGIDGMLKRLDPYTVYIGEKENDELDLVTTGKYGGIGVTIGMKEGYITIVNLMEGFSAAKQGIEIGDRIIEVDGRSAKGSTLESVRQLVRGNPGTELKIIIEREGEKKPLVFILVREEITVRNVAYTGYVSKGIGYIKLERFSRAAGEDLRSAIRDLQLQGELEGIILDLRDNPGGLLESAVDITSNFVPENSLIVSTRGRQKNTEHKYTSTEKPMVPKLPVAVLVNRYSASASEIVSGSIQDLDRGVIVGTRTFGKGLVQTVTRLSGGALLKMTTARYYTPSGRCIQEIDYGHKDDEGNGMTTPDSLKHKFLTLNKRPVLDNGGVMPDSLVTDTVRIAFVDELTRKAMFFKYANRFAVLKKTVPDDFEVSDSLINDFEDFLKQREFEFQEEGELKLRDLRKYAANERYDKSFLEGIDKLETILKGDKKKQVERYSTEIRSALKLEILARMNKEKAKYECSFSSDKQLQAALGILKNKKVYNKMLGIRSK